MRKTAFATSRPTEGQVEQNTASRKDMREEGALELQEGRVNMGKCDRHFFLWVP